MPIIHYRRFTGVEADKARKILGIKEAKSINPGRKILITSNMVSRIVKALKIEDRGDARRLIDALVKGFPGFAFTRHDEFRYSAGDPEDSEVYINLIGDKLPRMTGGITAHEIGHTETYKKTWPLIKDRIAWEGVIKNPILVELIAIYYSRAKSRDETVFRLTIKNLKRRYDEIKKDTPEQLFGASFEDMQTEAAMIVMRDLGVNPGPPPVPVRKMKTIYKAGCKQHPGKLPSSLGGVN
jgi:hypothetical protein